VLTSPLRKKFLVTKPHTKERICEAAKVLQEIWSHGGGGKTYSCPQFPEISQYNLTKLYLCALETVSLICYFRSYMNGFELSTTLIFSHYKLNTVVTISNYIFNAV